MTDGLPEAVGAGGGLAAALFAAKRPSATTRASAPLGRGASSPERTFLNGLKDRQTRPVPGKQVRQCFGVTWLHARPARCLSRPAYPPPSAPAPNRLYPLDLVGLLYRIGQRGGAGSLGRDPALPGRRHRLNGPAA